MAGVQLGMDFAHCSFHTPKVSVFDTFRQHFGIICWLKTTLARRWTGRREDGVDEESKQWQIVVRTVS